MRPLTWKVLAAMISIEALISIGDGHRDQHVEPRVAQQHPSALARVGDDPVLGQRRVEVDHVRHHRRPQDPDREQHRLGARERRHQPRGGAVGARMRVEDLDQVAEADRAQEDRDRRLERPVAIALEGEQPEGDDAR